MQLQIAKAAPAGTYLAFAFALYFWHVAASLLGAALAERLGISEASFDLKSDLKKLALCSLAALAPFFALFYFAQNAAVFIIYILCFFFSLKLAYLGEGHGFLLLVLGSAMAGMIAFAPVVRWLRLRGVFFLYLAALAAFLVYRLARRRSP
jgi:hypothetical protein